MNWRHTAIGATSTIVVLAAAYGAMTILHLVALARTLNLIG